MIRPVTTYDIPKVIEVGKRMHGRSQYAGVPFDTEHTAQMLARYAGNPDLFAMMASDGSGFLFGYLRPFFFSKQCEAVDALWYVENNPRAALKLLREFEAWADAMGATNVRIESGAGIDGRADALLDRLGYTFLGGNYWMRCIDVR